MSIINFIAPRVPVIDATAGMEDGIQGIHVNIQVCRVGHFRAVAGNKRLVVQ